MSYTHTISAAAFLEVNSKNHGMVLFSCVIFVEDRWYVIYKCYLHIPMDSFYCTVPCLMLESGCTYGPFLYISSISDVQSCLCGTWKPTVKLQQLLLSAWILNPKIASWFINCIWNIFQSYLYSSTSQRQFVLAVCELPMITPHSLTVMEELLHTNSGQCSLRLR